MIEDLIGVAGAAAVTPLCEQRLISPDRALLDALVASVISKRHPSVMCLLSRQHLAKEACTASSGQLRVCDADGDSVVIDVDLEEVIPPPPCVVGDVGVRRSHRCEHNKLKWSCKTCSDCGHKKVKSNCNICSDCGHNSLKSLCVICSDCGHGRVKSNCRLCSDWLATTMSSTFARSAVIVAMEIRCVVVRSVEIVDTTR